MPLSRTSSLAQIPSPTQFQSEHQIGLLDRSISAQQAQRNGQRNAEPDDSETEAGPADRPGMRKRITNNSLSLQQSIRKEISKQKYARYGQDRYEHSDGEQTAVSSTATQAGDVATAAQKSYLEQTQARAKTMFRRKRTLGQGKDEHDTAIDILYENQRGIFFFGIPKYSSNSLLPTDPKPWQNAQFRTSASDIRNAQVPDPSWEWIWHSWYVDMSRDVDEEGWEYSFAFVGKGATVFAWHGNHPWFHSFVRRRRWLRMRRRRDLNLHKTKEKAHELTADYFTIHPKTMRPASLADGRARSGAMSPTLAKISDEHADERTEIHSIGDLLAALRRANIDREKITAMREFVEHGGDEVFYLSEQMPHLMSMLIFQSSRRQVLSDLISRHDEAHTEQERLAGHDHEGEADDDERKQHDAASRRIENLLKALHAAEEEVQKLEFWSDVKGIDPTVAPDHEEGHEVPSFSNKQDPRDGVPELNNNTVSGTEDKSLAPSRKSSAWFDAQSQKSKGRSSNEGSEPERFVTAPESPVVKGKDKGKRKEKAKTRALDGVAEEAVEDPEMATIEPVSMQEAT